MAIHFHHAFVNDELYTTRSVSSISSQHAHVLILCIFCFLSCVLQTIYPQSGSQKAWCSHSCGRVQVTAQFSLQIWRIIHCSCVSALSLSLWMCCGRRRWNQTWSASIFCSCFLRKTEIERTFLRSDESFLLFAALMWFSGCLIPSDGSTLKNRSNQEYAVHILKPSFRHSAHVFAKVTNHWFSSSFVPLSLFLISFCHIHRNSVGYRVLPTCNCAMIHLKILSKSDLFYQVLQSERFILCAEFYKQLCNSIVATHHSWAFVAGRQEWPCTYCACFNFLRTLS